MKYLLTNSNSYKNSVVSSFIDSEADLVSPIRFLLALVLNSESNFITAKLMIWVGCSVATVQL